MGGPRWQADGFPAVHPSRPQPHCKHWARIRSHPARTLSTPPVQHNAATAGPRLPADAWPARDCTSARGRAAGWAEHNIHGRHAAARGTPGDGEIACGCAGAAQRRGAPTYKLSAVSDAASSPHRPAMDIITAPPAAARVPASRHSTVDTPPTSIVSLSWGQPKQCGVRCCGGVGACTAAPSHGMGH
jgi:hypothetical protein